MHHSPAATRIPQESLVKEMFGKGDLRLQPLVLTLKLRGPLCASQIHTVCACQFPRDNGCMHNFQLIKASYCTIRLQEFTLVDSNGF